MICFQAMFEDHTIVANRDEKNWKLKAYDTMTGKDGFTEADDQEMAAVMALLFGGDEIKGSKLMYPIAEPVCQRLGIRVIP